MRVRRCAVTFVELDQQTRFDLGSVFRGGDGLDRTSRWLVRAPHLELPVPIELAHLATLQKISRDEARPVTELEAEHGSAAVQALITAGLLLREGSDDVMSRRDAAARDVPWWTPALLAQSSGGWMDIDIEAMRETGDMPDAHGLVRQNGPAPEPEYRRRNDADDIALSRPVRNDFDALLRRRQTCRNYDATAAVSATQLATMLHRVWGAIGTLQLAPGAVAVKKTSPAGGGLHAVEAYVVVQRAEGVASGLYHYLPMRHALEPVRAMSADEAASVVRRFVAGQRWFFDVPVLVVMTARFDRLFWKYRRHAKAWRVVHLDVGHLSQTMYLSAADLGLGAFVTAAINDREIERALSLPPLREAAIAIVGFGARAENGPNVELTGLTPTMAEQGITGKHPEGEG